MNCPSNVYKELIKSEYLPQSENQEIGTGEHQQAEETLLESEIKYRSIL